MIESNKIELFAHKLIIKIASFSVISSFASVSDEMPSK